MHKLVTDIERVAKVDPDPDLKRRVKKNVLAVVELSQQVRVCETNLVSSFGDLLKRMREIAQELRPSEFFRAAVKERVLNFIEMKERAGFWPALNEFLWGGRRVLASVTVVGLLLLVVFPISLAPEALAKQTYLHIEKGVAWVQRGEDEIRVQDEMILQKGDEVMMGEDSTATVYFMDDSVARLAMDTRLKIKTLFGEQGSDPETRVALQLDQGKVWVKTVSLVGEDTLFQIGKNGVRAEVQENGTFEVEVREDSFQVAVAENSVDLHLERTDEVFKKTLIKGEGAIWLKGENQFRPIAFDPENDWWQENLWRDKIYLAQLEEANRHDLEQKAGILPDNPLYPIKTLSESAKLVFTFDKLEKEKQKLKIADTRLLEAEVMTLKGKEDQVEGHLAEFKQKLQEVSEEAKKIEEYDAQGGESLTEELEGNIQEHKKTLEPIADGSALYAVKNTLRETEVLVTSGEERSKRILGHAYDTLADAQAILSENENSVLVRARLIEYRREIQSAVVEIQQLQEEERIYMIQRFMEEKLRDLAVLKGMLAEDSLFQADIERVKVSLIYDLNRLILSVNDATGDDLEEVLEAQKYDEFLQTRILGELKRNVPWELRRALREFERAYTTDEIEQTLPEDWIELDSETDLLPQDVATPNVEVS